MTKNANGVTPRLDRKGDTWADCHRTQVDREYKMTDVDGMFGAMFYERDTSDQIWFEYVASPDLMRFGVTAIIERKTFIPEKHSEKRASYELQRAFLCWLARAVGTYQKLTPPVLYVVNHNGGHSEWIMAKIDPVKVAPTGQTWPLKRGVAGSWMDIWDAAGMVDTRIALRDLVP